MPLSTVGRMIAWVSARSSRAEIGLEAHEIRRPFFVSVA